MKNETLIPRLLASRKFAGFSPRLSRMRYVMRTGGVCILLLGFALNLAYAEQQSAVSPDDVVSSSLPRYSVAFQSNRDGNNEIYVMDPDGTNPTRLTFDPRDDRQPDLSPNGKQIVFASNRITDTNPEGDFEIFVMNSDRSELRQLTLNAAANPNNADDEWPRWSPNGKWIAFHSNIDGNYEIYVIRPDGTDLTRVTTYPGLDQFPEWSPSSKRLAIRRDSDIYVIRADGSNPKQLTSQAAINQMASWSADGEQIAFMSTREGYPSVFVMYADGSNQVNLTPKPDNVPASKWSSRAPAWWRNGHYLYFTARRPDIDSGGPENILAMNADGTGVARLTFADRSENALATVR